MEWLSSLFFSVVGGVISAMVFAERGRILFHTRQAGLPLRYDFWLYLIAGTLSVVGLSITFVGQFIQIEDVNGDVTVSTQLIGAGVVVYLLAEVLEKLGKK